MNSEEQAENDPEGKPWITKIVKLFNPTPRSREDINDMLEQAQEDQILDKDQLSLIEGALDVTNIQVRDVMIPRSKMVVINADETPEKFLSVVVKSGHSRFPVVGETHDDVLGVLHAKDLLPLILDNREEFDLMKYLRPVVKVPESKRLHKLLNDFRTNRNHMALVVDEYGGISGLITIEDVLEEIVGEIEDEFDVPEDCSTKKLSENDYILKAQTTIEEFNKVFDTSFDNSNYDTIAGLVTQQFGHVPQRNESVTIDKFTFKVLHADNRRLHLIRLLIED